MRKLVLGCAALSFLAGCATYNANHLTALDPIYVKEVDEIEGMQIGCKEFSKEDCEIYFDRNVIQKGYQPVQLTFFNETDSTYLFSTSSVSLPTARIDEVANKVHTNTVGRVAGYTAGSLFLWPLIIPAVVDGIKSVSANQRLNEDFEEKSQNHLILTPKSFNKTILFIPKESFRPNFEVTLVDERTGKHQSVHLTALK